MESSWTSSTVGAWMICGNGWSLCGHHHGWDMDAAWKWMESVWTSSRLGQGCSVETDGVFVDLIMVGTWILSGNGCNLCGGYHGWDMDAVWERMELRGRYHGWDMDALWEGMESVWTLSWLGHGSCGHGWSCLHLIMVGTWVLGGNGWSLCGLHHGWEMDAALYKQMESVRRTSSWLGHGCSVETDGVCVVLIMVGTWMLCGNRWSCVDLQGWACQLVSCAKWCIVRGIKFFCPIKTDDRQTNKQNRQTSG